ncbi:hypothetical protein [Vibrio ouci]|uniref:Uncharacterized protein n=1 Tax=Vibrio ouci TaxID=2499078 RepID=A0A4Y8WC78_9VIBR|nr:hypothetical protein [Vibrio ouci]TFH90256.1 hypothetical protein ELS82_17595 [Vibrio ouci]
MVNDTVGERIQLISFLLSSEEHRAQFLIDPELYTRNQGCHLDAYMLDSLTEALRTLEESYARVGAANPYLNAKATNAGAHKAGND